MLSPVSLPVLPPGLGQTQATSVYDRLRRDLLNGQLAPGQRLIARLLMERYDAGQTPLREALNRLGSARTAGQPMRIHARNPRKP